MLTASPIRRHVLEIVQVCPPLRPSLLSRTRWRLALVLLSWAGRLADIRVRLVREP